MPARLKALNMNPDAEQNVARGLHQFLNLGVAQLDAAVRESDARSTRLRRASLPSRPICSSSTQGQCCRARGLGARLAGRRGQGLQFYDKLIQRLTHVRSGLAIPADATADTGAATSVDWNNILDQVRARYSMVEERVLFDFMMRGLRAEQMLKALQSLREAAAPGELELF